MLETAPTAVVISCDQSPVRPSIEPARSSSSISSASAAAPRIPATRSSCAATTSRRCATAAAAAVADWSASASRAASAGAAALSARWRAERPAARSVRPCADMRALAPAKTSAAAALAADAPSSTFEAASSAANAVSTSADRLALWLCSSAESTSLSVRTCASAAASARPRASPALTVIEPKEVTSSMCASVCRDSQAEATAAPHSVALSPNTMRARARASSWKVCKASSNAITRDRAWPASLETDLRTPSRASLIAATSSRAGHACSTDVASASTASTAASSAASRDGDKVAVNVCASACSSTSCGGGGMDGALSAANTRSERIPWTVPSAPSAASSAPDARAAEMAAFAWAMHLHMSSAASGHDRRAATACFMRASVVSTPWENASKSAVAPAISEDKSRRRGSSHRMSIPRAMARSARASASRAVGPRPDGRRSAACAACCSLVSAALMAVAGSRAAARTALAMITAKGRRTECRTAAETQSSMVVASGGRPM